MKGIMYLHLSKLFMKKIYLCLFLKGKNELFSRSAKKDIS